MSELVIESILDELFENKNGYAAFVSPSGSGKTFETGYAIDDQIIDGKREIYYITPKLKNISDVYESIIGALKKYGREDLTKLVLKVDSNEGCVMNHTELILGNKITYDWDSAKELYNNIGFLENTNDQPAKREFANKIFHNKNCLERKFRLELKNKFRKAYNKYCNEHDTKVDEYEFMINSDWRFIKDLYPLSQMKQKRCFVMTSKKFILKNDPIIYPSYFNSENIEDAIVLIDEVDAVKEDILGLIINNQDEVNVIDRFGVIYDVFQNVKDMDNHMKALTKCEPKLNEIKRKSEILKEKYFPDQWEVCLFDVNEKGELVDPKVISMMMNYQGSHVHFDGSKIFKYKPHKAEEDKNLDEKFKCNKILPKNADDDKDKVEIYTFMKDLNKFIEECVYEFYDIAQNYMKAYNEELSAAEDGLRVTESNCIKTVLGKMHFDEYHREVFAEQIRFIGKYRKYIQLFKELSDHRNIYSKGLYFNTVSEDEEVINRYRINNYELKITPELMLLDWATKALVIGISATADVRAIDNFNLEFMKSSLESMEGGHYIELNSDQIGRLKKDYEVKTAGYKDVQTIVEPICIEEHMPSVYLDLARIWGENIDESDVENNLELPKEYFKAQRSLHDLVVKYNDDKDSKKIQNDYKRLLKVWKYFKHVVIEYKESGILSSGIVVCQKLPKDENRSSKKDVYTLQNLKLGLMYAYKSQFDISFKELIEKVDSMVLRLTTSDLKDSELNEKYSSTVQEQFKNNDLVFMVTSYGSVSRGNNLQVKIGKKEVARRLKKHELIKINEWEPNGYIDWDSIYVEKPKHVIPNISSKEFRKQSSLKLKTLLTIEEASEYLEISQNRKKKILNEVFACAKYENSHTPYYNTLRDLDVVKANYSVKIYQTIGRISRTNVKKPMNAIYYDEDLTYSMLLSKEELKCPIVTVEFDRFLESLRKQILVEQKRLIEESDEEARNKNSKMYYIIQSILNEGNSETGWSKDLQLFWAELRAFVLKHPVISKKQLKKAKTHFAKFKVAQDLGFDIEDVYVQKASFNKKYFYGTDTRSIYEDNDFENVLIQKKSKGNPTSACPFEVSIEDCRLKMLLNIKQIKEYWKNNGFSMDWQVPKGEKTYGVLTPIMYNNIYKGAIGEEVVKAMFVNSRYKLKPITDPHTYEKFDFVIKDGDNQVYIDAKNYSEYSRHKEFANEKLKEKVDEKMQVIGATHAMIINIVDEKGLYRPYPGKDLTVIPGLFVCKVLNNCELIKVTNEQSIMQYIEDCLDQVFGKEN